MQITNYEVTKGGKEQTSIIQSNTFQVPTKVMKRRNTGRVRTSAIIWVSDLIPIFQANEFARQKDKKTDTEIKSLILKKYSHVKTIINNFKLYRYTIGTFRNRYNETKLTQAQETPLLISLSYDTDGYPLVGAYRGQSWKYYIHFEECYHRCAMLKIADPRFVEYEKIVEIRNRLVQQDPDWVDWIAPTYDQLKKIAATFGFRNIEQIYNSVKFLHAYSREATPKDFIPFKWYDEQLPDVQ
jgi:hypothetical protein